MEQIIDRYRMSDDKLLLDYANERGLYEPYTVVELISQHRAAMDELEHLYKDRNAAWMTVYNEAKKEAYAFINRNHVSLDDIADMTVGELAERLTS